MIFTDDPVVAVLIDSDPGIPSSTITWILARQEPSFIDRNEKPLESRRVRTQPQIVTSSTVLLLASASLIVMRFNLRSLKPENRFYTI